MHIQTKYIVRSWETFMGNTLPPVDTTFPTWDEAIRFALHLQQCERTYMVDILQVDYVRQSRWTRS